MSTRNELEVGSIEWWLARLGRRLTDRQRPMRDYDDYYVGDQPLALASVKFAAAFGDRFPHLSANYMELVVDAHRERLHVQGVRIGDQKEGDRDAWDWWQRNHLDASSQILHGESLVEGTASVLVWPNADGEPEASVESPLEMVVEAEPSQPWRRRAAMKRYVGDDMRLHAELYLPDGVYKFVTRSKASSLMTIDWLGTVPRWEREELDEAWPLPNRLGVVPVVPFFNRPRLGPSRFNAERRDGRSEIAGVMSNQDAINKLRADAIIASEYAAFPQRFMIGIDVPLDPITNEPITDIRASMMHLWLLQRAQTDDPSEPPPQVGQFAAASLTPYFEGIESEKRAIASISRTPYHYLQQQGGQPPSGESLRSSEIGLVAKVGDSMLFKGDSWEEVLRLQFAWRGDERANIPGYEMIWKNPEYQTLAELVDALVKLRASLDLPLEVAWEKYGASPTEIVRWKTMLDEEGLAAAASTPLREIVPATPIPVARGAATR